MLVAAEPYHPLAPLINSSELLTPGKKVETKVIIYTTHAYADAVADYCLKLSLVHAQPVLSLMGHTQCKKMFCCLPDSLYILQKKIFL